MGTVTYTGIPGQEPEVIPVTEAELERFTRAHEGPVVIDGKEVHSKSLLSIVAELQDDELELLPQDAAEQILANIRRQKAQALLQRDLELEGEELDALEELLAQAGTFYTDPAWRAAIKLAKALGFTHEQLQAKAQRHYQQLHSLARPE